MVVLPTVMIGGVALLRMLIADPAYMANPLRQDLWRAGHAHAGVFLVLSLILLRYVDEAALSEGWKRIARLCAPIAAILMPVAFFLSVLSPQAAKPNWLISLAFVAAGVLAFGLVVIGLGTIRASRGMA
jgi:drug/metabolite transporter superfamily protein YnfA